MGGYGSGGHNRTHGRIEGNFRLDSFSLLRYADWFERLSNYGEYCYPVMGGKIFYNLMENTARISHNGRSYPLGLSKVPNVDGVSYRLYFHCPACGKRVRYLYRRFGFYICRKCAKLNYASQQVNGMEELRLKMQRIVEKDLGYLDWEVDYPNIPIQDLWYIPKPRYMRWKKYSDLIHEFRRLKDEHEREFLKGLLRCHLIPDDLAARVQDTIDSI